jgi:hypothetical protein
MVCVICLASSCTKSAPAKVAVEPPSFFTEVVPMGNQPGPGILSNFKILLHSLGSSRNAEVVLNCVKGNLIDRNGKTVLDLNSSPPFYGYKVKLVVDRKTGMPQELQLDPLFADGSNVGDSLTFEWDVATETFVKAFSNIP